MIIYKTEMVETQQLDKFICDRCKQVVDNEIDLQEAYSIRFTGGYNSVFGDTNNVGCDLCQRCLKDLIGDFCVLNAEE
jgi:hypothetical protein